MSSIYNKLQQADRIATRLSKLSIALEQGQITPAEYLADRAKLEKSLPK